jgi:hypothetical protein
MNTDVVEAAVLEPRIFRVKFADGLEGVVRFAPTAYRGVFARLRNPEAFNQLYINQYFVTWPGELDLCSAAMHQQIEESGEWVVE